MTKVTKPRAKKTPGSGTERSSRKAQEILVSAARTFRGHGFATASMAQIANDLGMTKSNLYYYFKSKEDILFASHLHLMDELDELVAASEEDDKSPEERLRFLTEGFIHIVLDEFQASALTQNIRGMTAKHQKQIIARRDGFESHYRKVIETGIAAGSFRELDVKLVGFAIFGSINWIHRWHSTSGSSDADSIAREFADFFIAGLKRRSIKNRV